MARRHQDFYHDVLHDLLDAGVLDRSSDILVTCGGLTDFRVLTELGFTRVTIGNVHHFEGNPFAPYAVSFQHAEHLDFPDGSFDFVIVHSGLHHLRVPNKGIAEMYRVARKGIIGLEPYRSLYTSLGVRLGLGQKYEIDAVFYSACLGGGVDDTVVPNLVTRFSRRDIEECVDTLNPVARHRVRTWTTLRPPIRVEKLFVGPLRPLFALIGWLGRTFPLFANNMAFYVEKPQLPRDLHPWLKLNGTEVVLNERYFQANYPAPSAPAS